MELTILEKMAGADQGILALRGRINAMSAADLKRRFHEIIASGKIKLVLEMSEVDFIDSSGLSALIAGLKYAREAGGSLRLAGLRDQAATVLRLTMLDRVFELYPDLAGALKGF